ncbi:MAG: SdpI family protein [Oscillibacter sp.]|nr:SdpI family protein [Oscillibacter sp.]
MTNVLFWLFMLVMALLIPGCMLFVGRLFLTNPPREINQSFGYRTARSMRSQEAWDFAHAYSGRYWRRASGPLLALSLVWMCLLYGREPDTVGIFVLPLIGIQLIPFLAVIAATERALKREFDDFGRKRS